MILKSACNEIKGFSGMNKSDECFMSLLTHVEEVGERAVRVGRAHEQFFVDRRHGSNVVAALEVLKEDDNRETRTLLSCDAQHSHPRSRPDIGRERSLPPPTDSTSRTSPETQENKVIVSVQRLED